MGAMSGSFVPTGIMETTTAIHQLRTLIGPDAGQLFDWGGPCRVLQGGSWHSAASALLVAFRGFSIPDERHYFTGFRCVSELPE